MAKRGNRSARPSEYTYSALAHLCIVAGYGLALCAGWLLFAPSDEVLQRAFEPQLQQQNVVQPVTAADYHSEPPAQREPEASMPQDGPPLYVAAVEAELIGSDGAALGSGKLVDQIAVATAGQTVRLNSDAVVSAPLVVEHAITLDGSGHTIAASDAWAQDNANLYLLKVEGGAAHDVKLHNVTLDTRGATYAAGDTKNVRYAAGRDVGGVLFSSASGSLEGVTVKGAAVRSLVALDSNVTIGNGCKLVEGAEDVVVLASEADSEVKLTGADAAVAHAVVALSSAEHKGRFIVAQAAEQATVGQVNVSHEAEAAEVSVEAGSVGSIHAETVRGASVSQSGGSVGSIERSGVGSTSNITGGTQGDPNAGHIDNGSGSGGGDGAGSGDGHGSASGEGADSGADSGQDQSGAGGGSGADGGNGGAAGGPGGGSAEGEDRPPQGGGASGGSAAPGSASSDGTAASSQGANGAGGSAQSPAWGSAAATMGTSGGTSAGTGSSSGTGAGTSAGSSALGTARSGTGATSGTRSNSSSSSSSSGTSTGSGTGTTIPMATPQAQDSEQEQGSQGASSSASSGSSSGSSKSAPSAKGPASQSDDSDDDATSEAFDFVQFAVASRGHLENAVAAAEAIGAVGLICVALAAAFERGDRLR